MIEKDLTGELWREYEFGPERTVYRIEEPQKLFYREGGTTHSVLTADGVIHTVPTVGVSGCVLRWENREGLPEREF